jgi:polyisoprenoid-binding protein YceI
MTLTLRRRLFIGSAIIILVLIVTVTTVFSQMLNPGHKGDTSTDLVTPTLSAPTARVFNVAPQESQIDFETDVHGISLKGVFPVEEGTITLEPVGSELRVLVQLNINVDAVTTGNAAVDRVLRAAMATGDYPIAFYVATSRDLVPVTEEPIEFALDGELQVHNVTHEHSMAVSAQLVGGDMKAVATSELDLADHGVEFPAIIGSTTITLTAHLRAYEVENPGTITPAPTQSPVPDTAG